ncbi:hypothetical protein [Paenibacillus sp. KN14-4R]|uniref:hypothetical protein n=1 Tax=Paenibacillus sp. KN14-4R TaxID=3445773 RepID=UPI003FA10974
MKKKLTIAALVLAVSAVGGSAFAASDSKVGEVIKASIVSEASSSVGQINAEESPAVEITESALTSSTEAVSLEQMAKEKGITVEELIEQLEKEGKLLKATPVTDSVEAEKATSK